MLKNLPNKHIFGVAAAVVAAAVIYSAWRWLERRAQNDALQKYLEQMRQLLTKEELRSSEKDSDVRVSARSQTLSVLQGLGPNGKRSLLRFLYESHLIGNDNPIVSLVGADLREADLRGANLSEADLSGVDLSEADLRGAILNKADLGEANLSEADLRGSNLSGTDLGEANLSEADLRGADLGETDLSEADLREADLRGSNLSKTDLSEADLRGANLSGAKDVAQEQLATCRSLVGATMPNGSKHD